MTFVSCVGARAVVRSWVEQSLAALQEGAEGEVVRRASELRHGARVAFDGARGDSADANSELPRSVPCPGYLHARSHLS